METKVEQLIKERSYGSLSHEELQAVQEWCASEQEFQQMKLLLQETAFLAAAMAIDPSPDIKKSLDAVFSAKHPGAHAGWSARQATAPAPAPVIPLYRKTWFRVAAVAVLFLGTIPFWQLADTEMKQQERPQLAKLETHERADEASPAASEEITTGPAETTTVNEAPSEAETDPSASADMTIDEVTAAAEPVSIQPTATYSYDMSEPVSEPALTAGKAAGAATLSSIGKKADLDPYFNMAKRSEGRAISLAQQPDDLLDLLVPAF